MRVQDNGSDWYKWKVSVFYFENEEQDEPYELTLPEGNTFRYKSDALQIGTNRVNDFIKKMG